MTERTVELDQPTLVDESAEALRNATERAERAEAELAKLRAEKPHTAAKADAVPAHVSSDRTAVSTEELKQPPTPSTAANATDYPANTPTERGSAEVDGQLGGEEELRKDGMMAHLLDALSAGQDVGHYGRLVFAMVARHFLSHNEVLAYLTKDKDFSDDQARQMLRQVEGRDYNPPRRDRLMEWQREQEFQFMDVHDPDSGNLYRNLKFPQEVYDHIGNYQEAKTDAA